MKQSQSGGAGGSPAPSPSAGRSSQPGPDPPGLGAHPPGPTAAHSPGQRSPSRGLCCHLMGSAAKRSSGSVAAGLRSEAAESQIIYALREQLHCRTPIARFLLGLKQMQCCSSASPSRRCPFTAPGELSYTFTAQRYAFTRSPVFGHQPNSSSPLRTRSRGALLWPCRASPTARGFLPEWKHANRASYE